MTNTPANPLENKSLEDFHRLFIEGTFHAEDITRSYLARIEKLNPKLQAFEYIDTENALKTAKAM